MIKIKTILSPSTASVRMLFIDVVGDTTLCIDSSACLRAQAILRLRVQQCANLISEVQKSSWKILCGILECDTCHAKFWRVPSLEDIGIMRCGSSIQIMIICSLTLNIDAIVERDNFVCRILLFKEILEVMFQPSVER